MNINESVISQMSPRVAGALLKPTGTIKNSLAVSLQDKMPSEQVAILTHIIIGLINDLKPQSEGASISDSDSDSDERGGSKPDQEGVINGSGSAGSIGGLGTSSHSIFNVPIPTLNGGSTTLNGNSDSQPQPTVNASSEGGGEKTPSLVVNINIPSSNEGINTPSLANTPLGGNASGSIFNVPIPSLDGNATAQPVVNTNQANATTTTLGGNALGPIFNVPIPSLDGSAGVQPVVNTHQANTTTTTATNIKTPIVKPLSSLVSSTFGAPTTTDLPKAFNPPSVLGLVSGNSNMGLSPAVGVASNHSNIGGSGVSLGSNAPAQTILGSLFNVPIPDLIGNEGFQSLGSSQSPSLLAVTAGTGVNTTHTHTNNTGSHWQ